MMLMIAVSGAAATASARAAQSVPGNHVTSGGTWGHAIQVPGLGALNIGGFAEVNSMSCSSAGNCVAGGSYSDRAGNFQAFVVDERSGSWHKAIEVPASGALNVGGDARVDAVSCPSAGRCTAAGTYWNGRRKDQAFVVDEQHGSWGKAHRVAGAQALGPGLLVEDQSVSCGAAGNCVAVGNYSSSPGHAQAFAVIERNGSWGKAFAVPGTGALNSGGSAVADSVSCSSAGNCSLGGTFTDRSLHRQVFVAGENNGRWKHAVAAPGLATLNAGGYALLLAMSCGSAGNCVAGGYYTDSSMPAQQQAYLVAEKNGIWGTATEVPGTATLNAGGSAGVYAVSCASAGNCAAGGIYSPARPHGSAFVISEKIGVWGTASQVPGIAGLNGGQDAIVLAISCASPGNCSAGGSYRDATGRSEGYLVTQARGSWGQAMRVPGLTALNTGGSAFVRSVSCPTATRCVAGGAYMAGSRKRAFVVTQG